MYEAHFTIVSNIIICGVPIVELSNSIIHTHYDKKEIVIHVHTEFSDNCESQYKSIEEIQSFAG